MTKTKANDYSFEDYFPNDILNKIKEYYITGRLDEELEEMSGEYDSEGNELTKEQAQFFKNSKVRDKQGRLLVCYHGTKSDDFSEFKYDQSKQTGTNYGKAFYFTTNYKKAQGYSVDIKKDKRLQQYDKERDELLKKYLKNKTEENRQAFLNYKVNGKYDLVDIIDDEDYTKNTERLGTIKKCYLNIKNPVIIDAESEYY